MSATASSPTRRPRPCASRWWSTASPPSTPGLLTPAVKQLRTAGFEIDDDDVSHLGPTMTEHINVHGRYHFNLDQAPKGLRDMPTLPLAGDH